MNQRFDPNDSRPINPASWPAEQASARIDPVTGAPVTDPERAAADPRLSTAAVEPPRESRSMWPLLIVLLAGVVLALLFWLPGEQAGTPAATDTATPPAATDTVTPPANDTVTPPASDTTTPATTPEATPNTGAAPDATTTTPDTTGTGTQPAPTTGTDQPASGTTPQATEPAPQN